jgi:hypothetical protein
MQKQSRNISCYYVAAYIAMVFLVLEICILKILPICVHTLLQLQNLYTVWLPNGESGPLQYVLVPEYKEISSGPGVKH